ncbi:MAG: universal stress protein [Pseudomonadota bacterium]
MRSIVVPVADRPECAEALTTAFSIADRLNANVHGFHIRPHRREEKQKARPSLDFSRGLIGLGDFFDELTEKQVELNSKAAARLFRSLCEAHGFESKKRVGLNQVGGQAVWRELVGSPQRQFAIVGPLADMIVVSRPKKSTSKRARAFLLAALMQSARPVLVLPQRKAKTVGRSILVAWNQSVEAAAMVNAAVPMLQTADAVHIVSAGKQDGSGPKSTAVAEYLRGWGVKATTTQTRGRHDRDELLKVYDDKNCDLMVMGAYSRARWRETVFGGLTEHVLFKAKLPVLMMHR